MVSIHRTRDARRRTALLLAGLATAAGVSLDAPAPGLAIALSVSPPAALTPFIHGSTATSNGNGVDAGILTVTDLVGWTLTAADSNTGTNAGHLVRGAGCSTGTLALAQPLSVTVVPTAAFVTASSSGARSLSASAQTVATGTGSGVVNTNYSQVIGSAEQLLVGCSYSLTVAYTLT